MKIGFPWDQMLVKLVSSQFSKSHVDLTRTYASKGFSCIKRKIRSCPFDIYIYTEKKTT